MRKKTALPGNGDFRPYELLLPRTPMKPRPKMGARIAIPRKAASLTQALATLVGKTQLDIAHWEQADKPPRADVLSKMAGVLGVRVENLLSPDASLERRGGPIGRSQRVFENLARIFGRQQDKVIDIVEAFVAQHDRRAS